MGFETSFTPTDEGFDYPGLFIALLQELDARLGTAAGDITVAGTFTANGNVVLGNASGDALTVAPNAVTWSNNPTHSGNHTFSGNVSIGGDTAIGNASGDALTVAPSAVTWSNNPTHSGNHTFSGNLTVNGNTTIGNASGDTLTIAPSAVTWSNNPTHSGNHTFSGNITADSYKSVKSTGSVANNGTADLLTSPTQGAAIVLIYESANTGSFAFVAVGIDGGSPTLVASGGPTDTYSVVKDTGGKTNIYQESSPNKLVVQNKTGGARTYKYALVAAVN